ncbi:malectin-B [Folsomia candida]|uniref:malectin-B n=1 Tax=Folsomia candida TaxID=158441 RepID=UPI000B9079CA|nr:malectin-B [Folsomia candida]
MMGGGVTPAVVVLINVIICIFVVGKADGGGKVVFAVNAGGEGHVDVNGIHYEKDTSKVGISSDYGKHLMAIGRVHPNDQILYQTERYHHSTFGYEIPIEEDGNYVMVIKFCEVYFNAPNMKVFDVVLNMNSIISDLDIYEKVGHGVAYDEIVPFQISSGMKTLTFNGVESEVRGGKIRVEFIKGYRDNPKVNAIYVIRGTEDDIHGLPPLPPSREEEEDIATEPDDVKVVKNRRPSGPKVTDPYEDVTLTSAVFPVFVAIGSFIPLLFCLCKL